LPVSTDEAVAWLRGQVQARLEMAEAVGVSLTGEVRAWVINRNGDFSYTVYAPRSGVPHNNPLADAWREDVAGFLVANDPRQIIADCESGLAILNEHHILTTSDRNEAYEEFSVVRIGGADRDHGCVTCHYYGMGGVKGYGICRTVKAVASGYRHRPGYAEHWGDSG